MAEPGVYLEKLSAFARMLRLEGLTVSPKELEDASRLLISLGLEDREQVKTAFRTVFAKSREEQISFDRVFDGFFISEEQMRKQAEEHMQRERELEQHRQEAEEELQLNGQPMDLSPEQRETYAAMPEEAAQFYGQIPGYCGAQSQALRRLYSLCICPGNYGAADADGRCWCRR